MDTIPATFLLDDESDLVAQRRMWPSCCVICTVRGEVGASMVVSACMCPAATRSVRPSDDGRNAEIRVREYEKSPTWRFRLVQHSACRRIDDTGTHGNFITPKLASSPKLARRGRSNRFRSICGRNTCMPRAMRDQKLACAKEGLIGSIVTGRVLITTATTSRRECCSTTDHCCMAQRHMQRSTGDPCS